MPSQQAGTLKSAPSIMSIQSSSVQDTGCSPRKLERRTSFNKSNDSKVAFGTGWPKPDPQQYIAPCFSQENLQIEQSASLAKIRKSAPFLNTESRISLYDADTKRMKDRQPKKRTEVFLQQNDVTLPTRKPVPVRQLPKKKSPKPHKS